MSSVPVAAALPQRMPRRTPPMQLLPRRNRLLALALLFAFGTAVFLAFFTSPDLRAVLGPLLACLNIALLFMAILYRRDGELPVFESGALCVLATTLYSVFPLLNFIVSGLRWRLPSDYRIVHYDPTPQQMGAHAWNHVIYLGTIAVVYLIVRGRKRVPRVPLVISPSIRTAVIVTFAIMVALVDLVGFMVLPPEARVSVYEGGNFAYRANVPLIFLQFLNIGTNALLALKLLFAILLLSRWRNWKWRMVLYLWIPLEFFLITRSFSRAPFVLLVITMAIAYHRLVRPFTLRFAAFAGVGLLAVFLAFGVYRDSRGRSLDLRTAFVTNNEFQGLFANSYDIYMRKHLRILPPPPPQLRWSELYMIIPSQLLPFAKVEPNEWYAEVLEISHTGIRTMFGVIAQSMLGYGTLEVFLRGVAIALILALLHRWYARRADRFWPTALYAYICIWTFYTYRSSTLTPLYFVIYYFGAAAFLVVVVKLALSVQSRGMARARRLIR